MAWGGGGRVQRRRAGAPRGSREAAGGVSGGFEPRECVQPTHNVPTCLAPCSGGAPKRPGGHGKAARFAAKRGSSTLLCAGARGRKVAVRRGQRGRQAAAAGWRDAGATHRPGTVQRRLRGAPHAGRRAFTRAARAQRGGNADFDNKFSGLSSGAREARWDRGCAGRLRVDVLRGVGRAPGPGTRAGQRTGASTVGVGEKVVAIAMQITSINGLTENPAVGRGVSRSKVFDCRLAA